MHKIKSVFVVDWDFTVIPKISEQQNNHFKANI
jgi:hypothetical protein